jgi:hypothetical protein
MSENSSTEIKRKQGKPIGSPKSGGRKPGVLNKKTYWLRDTLENNQFDWGREFAIAYRADEKDKCHILIDLLPYLNPRVEPKRIDEDSENDDMNINLHLSGLVAGD